MIVFILMLVFTLIITGVAIGIASYAAYITNMVSGEKLLYMDVEKGYKYATTFRDWQLYGNIAVIVAIAVWVIFIIFCVVKRRNKKKNRSEVNQVNSR